MERYRSWSIHHRTSLARPYRSYSRRIHGSLVLERSRGIRTSRLKLCRASSILWHSCYTSLCSSSSSTDSPLILSSAPTTIFLDGGFCMYEIRRNSWKEKRPFRAVFLYRCVLIQSVPPVVGPEGMAGPDDGIAIGFASAPTKPATRSTIPSTTCKK